jgi:hypothetical protein
MPGIDVYYNTLNKDMNVNTERKRKKNIIERYKMREKQADKFNYKLTLSQTISMENIPKEHIENLRITSVIFK